MSGSDVCGCSSLVPEPQEKLAPVLQWPGSKWKLAPTIIDLMPAHDCYVEVFGGSAAVLLRKPRAKREVLNDIDGQIVNLFRVLRDQHCELMRAMALTPFALDEYALCAQLLDDECECAVERARRFLVASWQGRTGKNASDPRRTGWRRGRTIKRQHSKDSASLPGRIAAAADRLRGVVVDSMDCLDLLAYYDASHTLFYVDPPYPVSTARATSDLYRHDMRSDDEHAALLSTLCALAGSVVLSGYRCDLYDEMLAGWERHDVASRTCAGTARTESVWIKRAS